MFVGRFAHARRTFHALRIPFRVFSSLLRNLSTTPFLALRSLCCLPPAVVAEAAHQTRVAAVAPPPPLSPPSPSLPPIPPSTSAPLSNSKPKEPTPTAAPKT